MVYPRPMVKILGLKYYFYCAFIYLFDIICIYIFKIKIVTFLIAQIHKIVYLGKIAHVFIKKNFSVSFKIKFIKVWIQLQSAVISKIVLNSFYSLYNILYILEKIYYHYSLIPNI